MERKVQELPRCTEGSRGCPKTLARWHLNDARRLGITNTGKAVLTCRKPLFITEMTACISLLRRLQHKR
eukprot:1143442-Pelagomonas_calceolata.AAC.4